MKPRQGHNEQAETLTGSTSHHEETDFYGENQARNSVEDVREDVADFTERYGLTSDQLLFTKAAALLQDDTPLSAIRDISEYELVALTTEVHHKWKQPKLMYLTIAMTALGAMGQGWAQTGEFVCKLILSDI